jgi:Rod binding domain-containing protein
VTTPPLTQQTSLLDTQAQQLVRQTNTSNPAVAGEDAKAVKAGKDFESILLGTWLQQAENSFATVPGGDQDDDADAGKDQFQGIAMQALAGSLTRSGGVGIAKMITQHLQRATEPGETPGTPQTSIANK